MATDLQILQALRTVINAQLGGAGPVTLVRMGRAIQRGLQRLPETTWSTVAGGQQRTLPDAQRSYAAAVSGGRAMELHIWTNGAAMHLYSGTLDTEIGGPFDGLVAYYTEAVDPVTVPDDATAWAWVSARISAGGFPAAP